MASTQQLVVLPIMDATSTKPNMPKNNSVPFFQRLFSRSKSQTEDELNIHNQLQRNSVVMSDSNNLDTVPAVPSHLVKNELISDTDKQDNTSGNDGNESETLKPEDTSISNENAIFEILDENYTGNEIQT